ncbi:MAG TPA: hypothetical protein VMX15_00745 [Candidatus Heimdallarchaeota archaeon]|nr:hypothetical protein [Candidatus Heimdallarchaeota archaeon]
MNRYKRSRWLSDGVAYALALIAVFAVAFFATWQADKSVMQALGH